MSHNCHYSIVVLAISVSPNEKISEINTDKEGLALGGGLDEDSYKLIRVLI